MLNDDTSLMFYHDTSLIIYYDTSLMIYHDTSLIINYDTSLVIYRSTSQCQTCLSRIHGICRSDHPFLSISPILLCISSLFMSNYVIMKSRLYGSGFSFPKISNPLLYHYLCRSKFCVGQKFKQYECQTK